MSRAIIEAFKTKKQAKKYIDNQAYQKDFPHIKKEDLFIYYEPEIYKDKPYTVNYD